MIRFFVRPDRRGAFRPIAAGSLALLALIGAAAVALYRADGPGPLRRATAELSPGEIDELRPQVAAFCGACHATPAPAGFPRAAWHEEVKKGYDFYFDSGRSDLSPPAFDRVVAWFRSQAPEQIDFPHVPQAESSKAGSFHMTPLAAGLDGDGAPPAVSFVKWCQVVPDGPQVMLWCDMRGGKILAADPRPGSAAARLVGTLAHPAHAEPWDLDGDGLTDLVVADLGSFAPSDHADGKVVWLRRVEAGGWKPVVIQSGLGRVADVQPGDFDGDGDLDLVVAEFGWRKTGRILLLENQGHSAETPDFVLREVDRRHGAIHVPPADLDGDGRLDFVALISQEHEAVVAFLSDGKGGFRKENIFLANEPAFGSSGIQLVDLDGDGDLDVLYTNGDTFDSYYPKPFHSIRWFENRGTFPFQDHLLSKMPGVHRALACDLDGDGDLDVAACALLPDRLFGAATGSDFDSLVWLEQTAPGSFARHGLERGKCRHAALEAGDFDGDGDVDLAVGNFTDAGRASAVEIWWNGRTGAPSTDSR